MRIRGELRAAGLELVQPGKELGSSGWTCPDGASALGLTMKQGSVEISAQVPSRSSPLTQRVDLASPEVSSEIVAVRAVETLRAAALEALGSPNATADADPTWVDFAQGAPRDTSQSRARAAAPASASEAGARGEGAAPAAPPATSGLSAVRAWAFGVGFGATGAADSLASALGLSLDHYFGPIAVGIRGRASLSPERTDAPLASLLLRTYGLEARALWFPKVSDKVELGLGAMVGFLHLRIDAIEAVGPPQAFDGASHSTCALGAGLALGYLFSPDFSLRAEGWVNGWVDAPNIDLAGTSVVLGRPEWIVTLGPVIRR
jgi:hypothetical protein